MSAKADIKIDARGNPILREGQVKILRYGIVTGPDVILTADALPAAVSLAIVPLESALSSGDKVRFGNLVATLSAPALVGTSILSITSLGGYLYSRQRGRQVFPTTAMVIKWILKSKTSDLDAAALLNITASHNDDANGLLDVTFTASNLTGLAGLQPYVYKLKRTDVGNEIEFAYGDVVVYE